MSTCKGQDWPGHISHSCGWCNDCCGCAENPYGKSREAKIYRMGRDAGFQAAVEAIASFLNTEPMTFGKNRYGSVYADSVRAKFVKVVGE